MRIGIMTFHRAHNYGAMLQTYAIKTALEDLGADVSVIDYAPDYIDKQYQYFKPVKNLKANILKAVNLFSNVSKNNKFNAFKNTYFNLVPFHTKETFDVIIYGSDQIWNPNISNGFDGVYFGVHDIHTLKNVAYAASIGKSSLNKRELSDITELLKNFSEISLREESAEKILRDCYDGNIEIVLDPTLLLSSIMWDKIAMLPEVTEPYILVYEVNKDPNTITAANKLSTISGFPIYEISYQKTKLCNKHRVFTGVGPEEFIGLIKNAEYVVTNSFHGTAFSLIYRKNFYTVAHYAYGSRMVDLLNKIGLGNRIIDTLPDVIEPIIYEPVSWKIENERVKSLDFIKRVILKGGGQI